jgi:hypothetical protein
MTAIKTQARMMMQSPSLFVFLLHLVLMSLCFAFKNVNLLHHCVASDVKIGDVLSTCTLHTAHCTLHTPFVQHTVGVMLPGSVPSWH